MKTTTKKRKWNDHFNNDHLKKNSKKVIFLKWQFLKRLSLTIINDNPLLIMVNIFINDNEKHPYKNL